jgi:phosphoglycolate phosphatase
MIRNLTGKSSIYSTVFFDLDGTITDSLEGAANGARYMFKNIGYTGYEEKKLKRFLGPPVIHHLISEYGFSKESAAEAYKYYREYYLSKGMYENRVYEGITEAVRKISSSGKSVYIATSKPIPQAMEIARHFGIDGLFDGIFGAQPDLGITLKRDVLENAIKSIGSSGNAVMVGDRIYDIEGGKHVGIDTVGVLYGYGEFEELEEAGCDYIVDTVEDLSELLGRIE